MRFKNILSSKMINDSYIPNKNSYGMVSSYSGPITNGSYDDNEGVIENMEEAIMEDEYLSESDKMKMANVCEGYNLNSGLNAEVNSQRSCSNCKYMNDNKCSKNIF
ncbi:hypothetical protein SAMN02745196_03100 [Clostridium collagenovorans DSM 3089]|uniref:Uncharacterized protein n=1 Tax=Clostridium collagenovorans DSM 3089 TaxID=1121306 RepID=A0A1M5YMK1_9CLOT|nr:hypothetical protein [Clostridium collagenovorans]SHI13315.1 hypothetical protein SAMN02745196_03100 [Clostridium collagenovorans DSM 3089]